MYDPRLAVLIELPFVTDRRTNRQTLSDRQWVTADDDDISLLVKQQMANANVEKERKKSQKNDSYTEVNNYKKMK